MEQHALKYQPYLLPLSKATCLYCTISTNLLYNYYFSFFEAEEQKKERKKTRSESILTLE